MPPMPIRRAAGRPSYGHDPSRGRRSPATLALVVLLLAGCGTPPELRDGTPSLPTRAATPSATGPVASTPPPATGLPGPVTPSPTVDAGLVAVACRGEPTRQRILDLVRGRRDLLPRDARVRVRNGPLCAADWQFTTLDVIGYEPLQVVTRDQAGALRLVTAGTDVCPIEVRVTSPPGIRTLACGDEISGGAPPPPTTPAAPTTAVPTPISPAPTPTTTGSAR
ncbi:hypothetical protein GCM10011608_13230 [Micromonospora sonchi]|uniref:Uncharacterized protein n=1 Tax=Micromonospora sonchi TaxID=1763543 RepID=A0A917WT83_9ACTN|nr:hypothetical protein GCM10011608_13230 [Micromonospora sonchi]